MDTTTISFLEERPDNGLRLLTQADMADRWGLTLQAVQNRKDRHPDFPAPALFVSRGKVALYWEHDVVKYEQKRGIK